MPELLTTGCLLACSFGDAPAPFVTLPMPGKLAVEMALEIGLETDIVPFLNIPSFVMCNSPANPEVIAATAAALGVFTPMPCIPVPVAPWAPPAPNQTYMEIPVATIDSKCICAWGGEISVDVPAQFSVGIEP